MGGGGADGTGDALTVRGLRRVRPHCLAGWRAPATLCRCPLPPPPTPPTAPASAPTSFSPHTAAQHTPTSPTLATHPPCHAMQWCTCRCCGLGEVFELIVAALGCAWWLAAAIILQDHVSRSDQNRTARPRGGGEGVRTTKPAWKGQGGGGSGPWYDHHNTAGRGWGVGGGGGTGVCGVRTEDEERTGLHWRQRRAQGRRLACVGQDRQARAGQPGAVCAPGGGGRVEGGG